MFIYIAWALIFAAVFLSSFYIILYQNKHRVSRDIEKLDYEPSVSILMPAYNEEGVVRKALESAQDIDYDNYEVIFVDDGSTDNTLEIAEEYESDSITVIPHEENQGKAAALNTGLEHTESEYVVVQDADSKASASLLEDSTAMMEQDPELGGVIAAIMPLNNNTLARRLQIIEYRLTNFYRHLNSKVGLLDVTPGAFSIYRTSDLKELDGFDVGNLTEDLEMAWRLRKSGKDLGMVFDERSHTELPATFKQLYNQRVRWSRGFFHNSVKHRDIFFNKEYGWFGLYQLPIQMVLMATAVSGFFMISFGIGQSLLNAAITVSAVGLKLPTIQYTGLERLLLNTRWVLYGPMGLSVALGGYVLKTAHEEAGDSINRPHLVFVYLFIYTISASVFWMAALLKEVFRSKRIWT